MTVRQTLVYYVACAITWTMHAWSRIRNTWSDYWYPPEIPYVESVLAISNDAYTSSEPSQSDTDDDSDGLYILKDEPDVHDWLDLTREYRRTGTIDLSRVRKKMDDFRIEYRYWFRRTKYRYTFDPKETDETFPPENLGETGSFSPKPLMAYVFFPEGHRETILHRVLKYAGPQGDFYGGDKIRCQWLFPWWTPESFVDVKLQILDTHIRMHTFNMEENGFLTLKTEGST